jgi:hypothetical protein
MDGILAWMPLLPRPGMRFFMVRFHRWLLIGSTLVASWLAMQAVHELGHVAGARLTGGRVSLVVLDLLSISRTDLAENPSPLLVVWAGPVIGAICPLALWGLLAALRLPEKFVARFFAGFCLVANGAYIGIGSFDRIGDCGEMLNHGSQPWQLWLFGLLTIPAGLWLWHGLGANFGFDRASGQVQQRAAYGTLVVCVVLILLFAIVP